MRWVEKPQMALSRGTKPLRFLVELVGLKPQGPIARPLGQWPAPYRRFPAAVRIKHPAARTGTKGKVRRVVS